MKLGFKSAKERRKQLLLPIWTLQSSGNKFNYESITLVKYMTADSWIGSPLFIFRGHIHIKEWYEQPLPEDYITGISRNDGL